MTQLLRCGVIGVDPSMSATGIVALTVLFAPPQQVSLDVAFRLTIKAGGSKDFTERLVRLHVETRQALAKAEKNLGGPQHFLGVALEDPADFTSLPGENKRSPHSIHRFGSACGVVALAARFTGQPTTTYDLSDWYPTEMNRRNQRHRMAKAKVLDLLQRGWSKALAELDEHQTMAAGIAMHHFAQRRAELCKKV